MNTSALILMLSAIVGITAVTGYFFIKVLRTKPKDEPDSYTDNDGQPR
ncbi:MAG TPA: hypothetical protein PLZ52_07405 [Bacteroidales bacterium]|nr:hypothetical protein [Bacteroidales bacterium]HOE05027.1 hypothetical protein [Bacteroidales bacterium]HQL70045.1 hypothetical protein [Bacteroidales bacterium]